MKTSLEIPMKLPSLNDYIKECRANKYAGANMKKSIENELALYINKLPVFTNPIRLKIIWIENNLKRDPDNIAFAKKFLLDTMVKTGKIKNDNKKYIVGFKDDFKYDAKNKIILEIEEESKI